MFPAFLLFSFCIISFCNAVKWNCFGCFDKNDSFNYEHGNSVQQSAQPYPTHESLMYAAPAQSATWVNNHSTASFQPFHHGNPYTAPHQQNLHVPYPQPANAGYGQPVHVSQASPYNASIHPHKPPKVSTEEASNVFPGLASQIYHQNLGVAPPRFAHPHVPYSQYLNDGQQAFIPDHMPPTTNTQQILKIFPGLAAPLHHQNAEVNPPNFVNPLPTQSAVGPSEINFQGNPNFPYSQDQTPNTAVHQQETEYSNSGVYNTDYRPSAPPIWMQLQPNNPNSQQFPTEPVQQTSDHDRSDFNHEYHVKYDYTKLTNAGLKETDQKIAKLEDLLQKREEHTTILENNRTKFQNYKVNFVPSAKVDLSSAKNQIIDLKTENANYSNKEHNIEDELPSVPTHKVTNKKNDAADTYGPSAPRWEKANDAGSGPIHQDRKKQQQPA